MSITVLRLKITYGRLPSVSGLYGGFTPLPCSSLKINISIIVKKKKKKCLLPRLLSNSKFNNALLINHAMCLISQNMFRMRDHPSSVVQLPIENEQ